eukprot:13542066-Ditylum_brightwellii.AAC.2
MAVGENHGSSCLRCHMNWAITGFVVGSAWEINSLADCSNAVPYMLPSTTPTVLLTNKPFITVNGCMIACKIQQWLHNNFLCSDIFDHIHNKTGLSVP